MKKCCSFISFIYIYLPAGYIFHFLIKCVKYKKIIYFIFYTYTFQSVREKYFIWHYDFVRLSILLEMMIER